MYFSNSTKHSGTIYCCTYYSSVDWGYSDYTIYSILFQQELKIGENKYGINYVFVPVS